MEHELTPETSDAVLATGATVFKVDGGSFVDVQLVGADSADLATVHFSRDIGTEGGWLPVRDCYRAAQLAGVPPVSSNEPIGPGASVSSETSPIRLVMAAALAA